MSNRLNIDGIEFHNPKTDITEFGVKVYDDYAHSYIDSWEDIPENDLEILERLWTKESNQIIEDAIDFIIEMSKGCYINDQWYEWDEIKHIFEKKRHNEKEEKND